MSKKILVVDDEKLIVKGIRFSLEQEGMEVDCAYDGEEALEYAKNCEYDLVLLDVMLPKIDGFQVCQQIREFSDMPVVMLTAKSEDMDKILGLEYGADDYITKPFSSTYLLARIKSLLQLRENLKNFLLAENKLPSSASLSPSLPKITRYDEDFIGKILQSVEENIGDATFKIEDLADSMNMGRSMFYRKVKSILGCTPIDFVKDMRVKRAAQLLEMSEYTVSEVAYMCGFSSPQYFSRVFKAAKGCTPTEYKENIIQKEEVENQPE